MEYHLIVLVHGLWGNASHFDYIRTQLEESASLHENSREMIAVYRAGSMEGYKTYDGIDLCGRRVAFEIERETELLNSEGRVTKISILGYSLGGLIARYAIGLLYYKGYFEDVRPVNFTTFCTPHVGVLSPGTGLAVRFFNWLVPILLANSGKQMFLKDKVKTTGYMSRNASSSSLKDLPQTTEMPLLLLMASPNSIFYRALRSFKYHTLYSNVVNDKRTPWWSAGISTMNPFEVLDLNSNVTIDENGVINFENGSHFELHFVKNYEPIILDVKAPIQLNKDVAVLEQRLNPLTGNIAPSSRNKKKQTESETPLAEVATPPSNFFQRKFKWVVFLYGFLIYAPVWCLWFIGNNLIQRIHSGVRVLRESEKPGILKELYSFTEEEVKPALQAATETSPLLERRPSLTRTLSETYEDLGKNIEANIHDHTDVLLESMWDAMNSKPAGEPTLFEESSTNVVSITTTLEELSKHEFGGSSDKDLVLAPFELGLSPQQTDIVHHLNQINWQKFPIHITKTAATHAAAIVRHRDETFVEGETVVRHWIDEQLKCD